MLSLPVIGGHVLVPLTSGLAMLLLLPIKLKQEAMNVSTAFSTIVFSSTTSPDKDCSFGLDLGVKRHKQSHSSCVN